MVFENEFYTIDADVDRTREYHIRLKYEGCDCSGCRNFYAAAAQMEPGLRAFLEQFGIDPAKPAEISAVYAPDQETVFYDGWYHLCGNMLRGQDQWVQTGPKSRQLKEAALIHLPEDSTLHFNPECHLMRDDFPQPALQLEATFFLPWVLEEKNTYL